MKKIASVTLVVGCLLSGCANESGARMGMFSATAPVIAVLTDDLFTGEAVGYPDRTGTINVASVKNPEVKCIGSFRYTGSKTGVANMRCNDGAEAELSFHGLSMLSGYGFGKTSRGTASFTFGLTPEQSAEYLKLPEGKRLDAKTPKLSLQNI